MTVLLDHLGAFAVLAVLAVALVVLGRDRGAEAVATSAQYADDRRLEAFTGALSRDLASAAALTVASGAGDASDVGAPFALDVHTDPAAGTTARVEYRPVPVAGGLRLERYVDGAPAGGSGPLLSWAVVAVDDARAPVAAGDATGLAVRLVALRSAAAAAGAPVSVAPTDTARWERALRAPALAGETY